MKRKYLTLALFLAISLFLTSCTEDKNPDISTSDIPAQTDSFTTPMPTQILDSNEAPNGESKQYEASFDFEEAIQNIYLFGQKISLPCTIEDFGDDFTLDESLIFQTEGSNYVAIRLYYKGKQIGAVGMRDYVQEEISGKQIVNLSLGDSYNNPPKDPWYNEEIELSFLGVSFSSTKEEIIEILGTPMPTERAFFEKMLVYDFSENGSIWIRFWEDHIGAIHFNLEKKEY